MQLPVTPPSLATLKVLLRDSQLQASVVITLQPLSGDIFENYCKDDNLATFGRFCFGLSIVTTFPLECFVTREVEEQNRGTTHNRMGPFVRSSLSPQVVSNVLCCRELTKAEHAGLTVLIVTACTSMSLAFDCLGVVLELNVSRCLHGSVVFNNLFMGLFPVMDSLLLYYSGRSECHSADLHHSICMLPQTVPWTVVSG